MSAFSAPRLAAALDVRLVENIDDLEALEPEWWDLWRRCPCAHPFQTPAWILPWWRCFAPGAPLAIAVREAGQLVALAPLYREVGAFGRRVLLMGLGASDYLDVLVDPACEAAGAALITQLAATAERWEACCLEELEAGAAALALPAPEGAREETGPQSACPVLMLRGTLGESVPSKMRGNLRTARNRAGRRGRVEIALADAASLPLVLDDVFQLHGARWRSRGEEGVLADERVRRFHEAAGPALLAAGLLRAFSLRIADRPAAAYYGFQRGDRAYAYLTGVDPDFAYESAGTLLMGHAIEDAVTRGAGAFHFLRGQEAYKYAWGAVDRWNTCRVFMRGANE